MKLPEVKSGSQQLRCVAEYDFDWEAPDSQISGLCTCLSCAEARDSQNLDPAPARTAEMTKIRDDHFVMTQGNSKALVHVLPRRGNR